MPTEAPARVAAPVPLWRIGWRSDPRRLIPSDSDELAASTAGGPFDSVTSRTFSVAYAGTTRESALVDCAAVLAPDRQLAELVRKDWAALGHLPPGTIAASWRHRRRWTIGLVASGGLARFLDIAQPASAAWLQTAAQVVIRANRRYDLAPEDLIGPSADRRLTRTLGTWIQEQLGPDGRSIFDGIRYPSRHDPDLERWALFDGAIPVFVTHSSIRRDDAALAQVARRFGLTFL